MAHAFGEFVFDAKARLLTRKGEPVHLTAKACELLQLLASRRPDAVAKKRSTSISGPTRSCRMSA